MDLSAKARKAYQEMVAAVEREANEIAKKQLFMHMGHSRTPSACSAISFTSSILSEPISENYPMSEPESEARPHEPHRTHKRNTSFGKLGHESSRSAYLGGTPFMSSGSVVPSFLQQRELLAALNSTGYQVNESTVSASLKDTAVSPKENNSHTPSTVGKETPSNCRLQDSIPETEAFHTPSAKMTTVQPQPKREISPCGDTAVAVNEACKTSNTSIIQMETSPNTTLIHSETSPNTTLIHSETSPNTTLVHSETSPNSSSSSNKTMTVLPSPSNRSPEKLQLDRPHGEPLPEKPVAQLHIDSIHAERAADILSLSLRSISLCDIPTDHGDSKADSSETRIGSLPVDMCPPDTKSDVLKVEEADSKTLPRHASAVSLASEVSHPASSRLEMESVASSEVKLLDGETLSSKRSKIMDKHRIESWIAETQSRLETHDMCNDIRESALEEGSVVSEGAAACVNSAPKPNTS